MTSLHRLIAIVLVWIAIVLLSNLLFGLTGIPLMNRTVITVLFVALFAAGALSTWAIARAGVPRG